MMVQLWSLYGALVVRFSSCFDLYDFMYSCCECKRRLGEWELCGPVLQLRLGLQPEAQELQQIQQVERVHPSVSVEQVAKEPAHAPVGSARTQSMHAAEVKSTMALHQRHGKPYVVACFGGCFHLIQGSVDAFTLYKISDCLMTGDRLWRPQACLPPAVTAVLIAFLNTVTAFQTLLQELAASRKQHEDQQAAQAAAREAALAPARKLAATLVLKGYKLTLPEVHVGDKKPYVDQEGCMHWPVMLVYPETGQQDVIQDWHEDDLVEDHLDVVSVITLIIKPSGFQGCFCATHCMRMTVADHRHVVSVITLVLKPIGCKGCFCATHCMRMTWTQMIWMW
jgi:hypothetical protein